MALYKGDIKLSGTGNGFEPLNSGSTGQILKKYGSGYRWENGTGTGDVVGPNSSVDGHLAVFDGISGKVIKDGGEIPTYTAGEGIEIKNGPDYSAMQGPAPIGYHVPLRTEWQSLIDVWTGLGGTSGDSTGFGEAFKIPLAGYHTLSDGGTYGQGSRGYYWTATPKSNDTKSYQFAIVTGAFDVESSQSRSAGNSLRCFKDEPVIPTSSWTKLYGTSIEAGGIFWSSTDGLISLSSDGTTWITILDKNLGATTAWNSGDALSEANCGKYYQWGNNYGFNWDGTATTSPTQIDASTYGPGNYYNSSTFIIPSSSPYDRSSVQNDNLWGGVTGVVTLNNSITNTGVLSVNGQTGAVTLDADDISDSTTTNKFVTSTEKSEWSGKQDSLTLPATPTQGHLVTWGADNETLVDGGAVPTGVPSGGNNGDVLTNVSGTPTWSAPTGGIQLAPNTELNIKYHWYGSQASYDNLNQYYTDTAGDTAYFTI